MMTGDTNIEACAKPAELLIHFIIGAKLDCEWILSRRSRPPYKNIDICFLAGHSNVQIGQPTLTANPNPEESTSTHQDLV